MPTPKTGELVVQNAAVAMNGVDNWMLEAGVFVKQWPAIIRNDVAGIVYATSPDVQRFKKGDRVIRHGMTLVTGRPEDGAFALYTVVRADRAAILPESIAFTEGVVMPLAVGAAACALFLQKPGEVMPGVPLPLLGLPYPSLQHPPTLSSKTLIIYGGSSTVGSTATQLATAAGVTVFAITGAHNFTLSQRCGAAQIFDHKDAAVVDKVVEAVAKSGPGFIGIFDAIANPETYPTDLAILATLGGGHLVCSHPPPANLPANVTASMIFSVNDVSIPVFTDYITPALQAGKLQCLPKPIVVRKGLEHIQDALKKLKEGVSAGKVVVEL
ncbi:chaperonin 10-like protein [Halenospora varia]|nr:chaperonin 10-like protein [Halenospora varia]